MSDSRMIILSVIGSARAMTTVIVAFIGIVAGGINDRIDDVNPNVNNRIDDLNTSVNSRFNDVNNRIDDLNASANTRLDDVNRRIDDLQEQMRELRTLVIDAIKGANPADN